MPQDQGETADMAALAERQYQTADWDVPISQERAAHLDVEKPDGATSSGIRGYTFEGCTFHGAIPAGFPIAGNPPSIAGRDAAPQIIDEQFVEDQDRPIPSPELFWFGLAWIGWSLFAGIALLIAARGARP